jgi:hypothetical protein
MMGKRLDCYKYLDSYYVYMDKYLICVFYEKTN